MAAPKVTDAEFRAAWHQANACPERVAAIVGTNVRNVYARRDRLARRGVVLPSAQTGNAPATWLDKFRPAYPREKRAELRDGVILVGSDAHIWPGEDTPAMRGFLSAIEIVRPRIVVANGDWFDGARVSRHGRTGWAKTPTMTEELGAVKAYADRVVAVASTVDKACVFEFCMGNHDLRYDNYLSSRAPEAEDMPLMRLEDHFPRWSFQWSLFVNRGTDHPVMIKHRFASAGIHAGYNATLRAGMTTVSGHTHLLEAKAWGDYRGRRWGIQTGTLSDLHAPSMEYSENNPTSACPGFVVLTFRDGRLMPPELAEVHDGRCIFRGEVIA